MGTINSTISLLEKKIAEYKEVIQVLQNGDFPQYIIACYAQAVENLVERKNKLLKTLC